MKVVLKEITAEMTNGNEKLANIINENLEALNQHQHNREELILQRYGDLQKSVDGVKELVDRIHGEIIHGFNNTDAKIVALDTKINQVSKRLGEKIDSVDRKTDDIIDRLGGIENLLKG